MTRFIMDRKILHGAVQRDATGELNTSPRFQAGLCRRQHLPAMNTPGITRVTDLASCNTGPMRPDHNPTAQKQDPQVSWMNGFLRKAATIRAYGDTPAN